LVWVGAENDQGVLTRCCKCVIQGVLYKSPSIFCISLGNLFMLVN